MMKKLLTLLLMLSLTMTIGAQTTRQQRTPSAHNILKKGHRSPQALLAGGLRRAPQRAIEVGSGQMWFGYDDADALTDMGLAINADYHLAVYIPYGKIAGKGATIDAVRFMLQADKVKNLKVWVSTELPAIGEYDTGADLEVKSVFLLDYKPGEYTEVKLSKSYEIPEGGLWIGLSFEISGMPDAPDDSEISDEDYYGWWYEEVYVPWLEENEANAYPFFVSFADQVNEGTMVFASKYFDDLYTYYAEATGDDEYLDMLGWDDYSAYGYCVALEALVGGDKFLDNAASVEGLGQKYALINSDVTFPLILTNSGKNGIQNFTYEVTINGTKTEEKTITLEEPVEGILKTYTTEVSFGAGSATGTQNIQLTVTKINGQPNEVEAKVNGSIFVLSETAQRTPLVEEYTGTWCGWCPRGMVGLEKIAEDYKDKVIPIAIHNGDPMEIDAYTGVIASNISGFPSMLIDRAANVDPYYGSSEASYGVKDDVEAAFKNLAAGTIAVKAAWADKELTRINIETQTKMMYSEPESSVAIGYVVVADGLSGKGREWAQSNYYSGDEEAADGDAELLKLVEQDEYIIGMEFNHVAVAAWGVENGVEGSITGAITAGQNITSTFKADLTTALIGTSRLSEDEADHVTVADLVAGRDLQVVAILFNKQSGEVINAAEVTVAGFGADAIAGVDAAEAQPLATYNLAGQQIARQQRGVNIVRLSNGKALKVLVK